MSLGRREEHPEAGSAGAQALGREEQGCRATGAEWTGQGDCTGRWLGRGQSRVGVTGHGIQDQAVHQGNQPGGGGGGNHT